MLTQLLEANGTKLGHWFMLVHDLDIWALGFAYFAGGWVHPFMKDWFYLFVLVVVFALLGVAIFDMDMFLLGHFCIITTHYT